MYLFTRSNYECGQYLVTKTYCHVTSDQAFYPDESFFPNMSATIFGMDYI